MDENFSKNVLLGVRKMQHEHEDYTFSQNQYEDYLTLNGIVNRTGVAKEDSYTFILKELLDNAIDAVEKSDNPLVEVNISRNGNLLCIVVRNLNESNKVVFSKSKLDSIFNLSKFTSSKRGLFRISRGALGDALKYVLGMPYALAKELHVTIKEAPLTIRTNQQVFNIKLNVDNGDVKEAKQEQSNWTEIEVRLPIVDAFLNLAEIQTFLKEYVLFSTHVSFKFTLNNGTQTVKQSFPQTQSVNKKWVNHSSIHYYSLPEFEPFVNGFDDDNAEVYTVMQRLFREGSSMKKAGFDDMTMGELKKSTRLKKKLFQKMRNVIRTPPQKLSLPFDSNYKVRPQALKRRLEQRGLRVSSMKYKSKYGNYSSMSDGIGFPFFVEVAVFHSDDIVGNLYYMNALNNAMMPGNWSYLYGADDDTFVWFTEADREKNHRMAADDLDVKCHESRDIHEILVHYGYSHDEKKSKKKHSMIAINLIAPKIIVENYGKSDIVLKPFAELIGELVARACEGGGTQDDRPSRIECMRHIIKPRYASVVADKTLKDKQRWTRSTAFYTCRKLLKSVGYADEEINRENVTEYIEHVCDEMGITREDCGIYAADRAQLYFRGKTYDIGFDDLEELAQKGVDILIIEKEGGAEQLAPLAAKKGIALLNARGFLVNYAVKLAQIAHKHGCNIAIITDLDIYGLTIATKIPNVYRIGINFKILEHFGLNFEDVEEEYNAPSFDIDFSKVATEEELEFLKTKRIEIDSVMIAVGDNQKFWEYIVKELEDQFPTRNYNRGIDIPDYVVPTVLEKLNDMVRFLSIRLTQDKCNEISDGYDNYEGFIDDVDEEEKANTEELKTVIETDKHVMERVLGEVQELIDKNKKKVDELIQDYDDAARNRLTYSQYQKWKVIEAGVPKDKLQDKFIEKHGDIDKLYDEIVGQKGENHERGSSKSP
jgi:hypothetical protein